MIKLKNITFFIIAALVLIFMFLIVMYPNIAYNGVKKGLLISGEIIIPSLFPFCVCVNFLMRCKITSLFQKLKNVELWLGFIFSLVGGFPVGAGILEGLCKSRKIAPKTAEKMLLCFVNSGPAFIIIAVGEGVLGNKTVGYILLFSHILTSVIMYVFLKKHTERAPFKEKSTEKTSLIECFTESTADSAAAVFSICSGVVLFSGINAVISSVFSSTPIINKLLLLSEISYAVTQTKNIYEISFLLGFSGLCVWFQILSTVKSFRVNLLKFALARLFHGTASSLLTALFLRLIPVKIETISNSVNTELYISSSGIAASVSVIMLSLIWIISLFSKNSGRNFLKDIV